jgi:hypothetical protein
VRRFLLAVPSVPQLGELKKLGRSLLYPVLANNSKKSSRLAARISEHICHSSNHTLTRQGYSLLRLATPAGSFLSHHILKVFLLRHVFCSALLRSSESEQKSSPVRLFMGTTIYKRFRLRNPQNRKISAEMITVSAEWVAQ